MTSFTSPSFLSAPLSPGQLRLLQTIYDGFSQTAQWPIWQYPDLLLDERGINAAEVLSSLPRFGEALPDTESYGLTTVSDHLLQPRTKVRLTVAGLSLISDAAPLLHAFLETIKLMVNAERDLTPDPEVEREARLTSKEVGQHLMRISQLGQAGPPLDKTVQGVGTVLQWEPFTAWRTLGTQPDGTWELTVKTGPMGVRAFRNIQTVDDYITRVTDWLTPTSLPPTPHSIGALDLPYACDYLDAIWKAKVGTRLFAVVRVGGTARLSLACGSQEEFNSQMTALAELFAGLVAPGNTAPPRSGALQELKKKLGNLPQGLAPTAIARIETVLDRLINLTQIRHGQQHGDAAEKAIKAYRKLGITYPAYDWSEAWGQVLIIAKGAVDTIREEIEAGLPDL
jgi:hypothetical protein